MAVDGCGCDVLAVGRVGQGKAQPCRSLVPVVSKRAKRAAKRDSVQSGRTGTIPQQTNTGNTPPTGCQGGAETRTMTPASPAGAVERETDQAEDPGVETCVKQVF